MKHYCDVTMGAMASQITSLNIVYSTVHSGADQRKHQSSASLAFVRGIHRLSMNSPHKWPVTRKMFPFDDVIMTSPARYAKGIVSINREILQHHNKKQHTSQNKHIWCDTLWCIWEVWKDDTLHCCQLSFLKLPFPALPQIKWLSFGWRHMSRLGL